MRHGVLSVLFTLFFGSTLLPVLALTVPHPPAGDRIDILNAFHDEQYFGGQASHSGDEYSSFRKRGIAMSKYIPEVVAPAPHAIQVDQTTLFLRLVEAFQARDRAILHRELIPGEEAAIQKTIHDFVMALSAAQRAAFEHIDLSVDALLALRPKTPVI